MLWYKAWLESRVRFLASAIVLALYCVSFVEQARVNFPPIFEPGLPYSAFVWRGIYNGIDSLFFVAMALLLGWGGLQRERASGTVAFTLALPVTRLEVLRSRATVAIVETMALAAIPALTVPWLSERIGHPYSAAQAMRFAALFAAAGAVWSSVGLLWSTLLAGEHGAIVASLATPVLYAVVMRSAWVRQWPAANIFNVMNGARLGWLDARTSLLVARFPWPAVLALAGVAAGLLVTAAAAEARDDF
jgi:ABC-2 type transport system permease protein